MSQVTTHVLDTGRGCPAAGVDITLSFSSGEGWEPVGQGRTDADGRVTDLCTPGTVLSEGTYRIRFDTGQYFEACKSPVFYPWADVVFNITAGESHYHIPLLLSGYGYSTYRGS